MTELTTEQAYLLAEAGELVIAGRLYTKADLPPEPKPEPEVPEPEDEPEPDAAVKGRPKEREKHD